MSSREDAIIEINEIMQRHDLAIADLTPALSSEPAHAAEKTGGILSRAFSYIGGIFIFAGLAIFIGMQWGSMSPLGHVFVTLGSGMCLFVMAIACTTRERLEKLATPLFLIAALLESVGIVVLLNEFYTTIDQTYGFLALHVVLALQQGCVFYATRRTVLALTTIYFTLGACAITFDLLGVSGHLNGIVCGISLLCIGWSLARSRHSAIAPFVYLCGSSLFLFTAYDWLDHSPIEILFLGLACGIVYLSVVARSRILLFVGTVALIGYIGDFMYDHFGNSLAGPLGLVIAGFLLVGIGMLAVRINKKFIAAHI